MKARYELDREIGEGVSKIGYFPGSVSLQSRDFGTEKTAVSAYLEARNICLTGEATRTLGHDLGNIKSLNPLIYSSSIDGDRVEFTASDSM